MIAVISGTPTSELARVIQVAVGPMVLISGVGLLLLVLTNRLARIVDRARKVNAESTSSQRRQELKTLGRRARLVHGSITLLTLSVLLVGLLISVLFLGALMQWELWVLASSLFVGALLAIVMGMLLFLREIFVSLAILNFEPEGPPPPEGN